MSVHISSLILNLTSCIFSDIVGCGVGGAVFLNCMNISLHACLFGNCTSSGEFVRIILIIIFLYFRDGGGALYVSSEAHLNLTFSTFISCTVNKPKAKGGAIYINDIGDVRFVMQSS
jgi:hypothetical protein